MQHKNRPVSQKLHSSDQKKRETAARPVRATSHFFAAAASLPLFFKEITCKQPVVAELNLAKVVQPCEKPSQGECIPVMGSVLRSGCKQLSSRILHIQVQVIDCFDHPVDQEETYYYSVVRFSFFPLLTFNRSVSLPKN